VKQSLQKITKIKFRSIRWTHAVIALVAVGAIGALFLALSHADTSSINAEAENGVLGGNAQKVNGITGASGGSIVTFKSGGGGPTGTEKLVLTSGKLLTGSGAQMKMAGICVWGIQDQVTENSDTGNNNYANRVKIANNIKAWGGNHIRLRVLASDYDDQAFMPKAQYIQQIKDWRDAAKAAGLYLQIVWWDSLDGNYEDAGWASNYSKAFPMMKDVVAAIGDDPMVYYEPFNEPNGVSESAWLTAMKATIATFRTAGYTGILLLDTTEWSHTYNDADFTALEQHDSTQTGMNGKHQIIFAKHDYGQEYSGNWSESAWKANNGGWDMTKHAVWETEFGNYVSSGPTPAWSKSAAIGLAQKVSDGTIVGATAFVYNWVDANTMVGSDLITPNEWGGYVKNNFLAGVQH